MGKKKWTCLIKWTENCKKLTWCTRVFLKINLREDQGKRKGNNFVWIKITGDEEICKIQLTVTIGHECRCFNKIANSYHYILLLK